MEKSDRPDNDQNPSPNTASTATNDKQPDQKNKSKPSARKTNEQKKKSFRRSWQATGAIGKVGIIFAGLGAISALAYVGVTIWQTLQAKWAVQIEHSPLVINSRPPQLLQPFICYPQFKYGNFQSAVKNVGSARAVNVSPPTDYFKIIPEVKTGNALIDTLPPVNCDGKYTSGKTAFNLAPGEEVFPQTRQGVRFGPPFQQGEVVQLFLLTCVYYSDDYAVSHTTCDTYRLNLPSTNPLDILAGSPSFVCDANPKIGKFISQVTGHCQK